jgi:hypothetical protein
MFLCSYNFRKFNVVLNFTLHCHKRIHFITQYINSYISIGPDLKSDSNLGTAPASFAETRAQ